ncbi:MAG: HEAT repeat domain-containing protein [Candidatus Omnitrophica bacterium]|nr:HEAT repeat domain-containing protein [Candidatus Omnitrophota bacterium]
MSIPIFFRKAGLALAVYFLAAGLAFAQSKALSPKATEALRLIESRDFYQRQLGFLRLEALREVATADFIRPYLKSSEAQMRAGSLRALAAIEGSAAIPVLREALQTDRDPSVRRAALLGLEPLWMQEPQVLNLLIAALRDRSTESRITAVDIVSRIDHPYAKEAILQRHAKEQRRDVKRVLHLAVKRVAAN